MAGASGERVGGEPRASDGAFGAGTQRRRLFRWSWMALVDGWFAGNEHLADYDEGNCVLCWTALRGAAVCRQQ
eukprot:3544447-Rhodomonas_salina.4